MERRAIMIDVDGVLITHPDARGWTENLQRDLGISAAALQDTFFLPHWDDIVHGRATLRERLIPALAKLSAFVSYDELVQYWFSNDAHINESLLCDVDMLRKNGVEAYLATVQEHERADYLWNNLRLRERFDGIHYAAAIGSRKPSPAFYRSIEAAVGLDPSAIFFVDDQEQNVAAAKGCGWTAAVWTGQESLGELIFRQHWDIIDDDRWPLAPLSTPPTPPRL